MPEQVSMQARQGALLGVVADHLLDCIYAEWPAPRGPFEGQKNLRHVRKEILPFPIQILVQGREGERIHKHRSGVVPFCHGNVQAASATFDILKTNTDCFTDPQTTDPHQQNQSAVPPAAQRCEESAQFFFRQDLGNTLSLLPVQTLSHPL